MKRFLTILLVLCIGAGIGYVAATRPWQSESVTNQTGSTRSQSEQTTNTERLCSASDLSLSVQPAENGNAAGSTYLNAVVTNQSDRTCDLSPGPTISLRSVGDQMTGSAAELNGSAGNTVSLPAGKSAYVLLRFVDETTGNGTCRSGVTSLRLALGGSTDQGYLSAPLTQTSAQTWCPGFSRSAYTLDPQ